MYQNAHCKTSFLIVCNKSTIETNAKYLSESIKKYRAPPFSLHPFFLTHSFYASGLSLRHEKHVQCQLCILFQYVTALLLILGKWHLSKCRLLNIPFENVHKSHFHVLNNAHRKFYEIVFEIKLYFDCFSLHLFVCIHFNCLTRSELVNFIVMGILFNSYLKFLRI